MVCFLFQVYMYVRMFMLYVQRLFFFILVALGNNQCASSIQDINAAQTDLALTLLEALANDPTLVCYDQCWQQVDLFFMGFDEYGESIWVDQDGTRYETDDAGIGPSAYDNQVILVQPGVSEQSDVHSVTSECEFSGHELFGLKNSSNK